MTADRSPIKIAVVGFGLSATVFHLPFIQASPDLELTAISTRQKQAVIQRFPMIQHFDSAQQMLENSDAQLVIITSPNDTHYSLASTALNNGKHVIIEKPFVTCVEQGKKLITLAASKKKIVAPFHNRRWDGDFLTLQHLINTQQLGEIKYVESHFDRFRPAVRERWREQPGEGVGILFDLGPHLIDQAINLFGLPEAITARCLALRDNSQVTDFIHICLHYSHKEVVLHSSPYTAAPMLRFHVQGTKASYLKYGLDPQEAMLNQGATPDKPDWAAESPKQFGTLYSETEKRVIPTLAGNYQRFFDNVINTIRGKETLIISPEQALESIRLIELALRSNDEGKTLWLD